MSVEKIANRQLFFMLFMIRSTVIIAFLPVVTTHDALQDAWASAVVSFFGAALLVIIIGGLGIRFPDMTAVEYGQKLLGTWPGKIVSLFFLWGFLHMASTDVRIYGEALVTGFLTETPLTFIIATMVLTSALAAYNGIESIGRAADLLFPFFLIMILFSLLAPLPNVLLLSRNLEPILARGAAPVFGGSIVPVAVAAQFLILTMLIPTVTQPKKALRTALWALAASTVVLVAAAVVTVGVLGPHKAARTVFPFFGMIRTVQLGEFVERVEVLAIFAWGFGLFIGVAVFIFCGARGLSQVLGLKSYRPLIGPMAVIWITLSVHEFENVFELRMSFQPHIYGPYAVSLVLIPFGLFWGAYLFRRLLGGGNGAN